MSRSSTGGSCTLHPYRLEPPPHPITHSKGSRRAPCGPLEQRGVFARKPPAVWGLFRVCASHRGNPYLYPLDRFVPRCMGLFCAVAHPVPERRQGRGSARPGGALRGIPTLWASLKLGPLQGLWRGIPLACPYSGLRRGSARGIGKQGRPKGGPYPKALPAFPAAAQRL